VALSLALNFAAGDLEARGYRVVNLALHLACALTLYGILRRTLERIDAPLQLAGSGARLATAIALLWLVHPLQTESINYISQRTETLMGFNFLMTIYCLLRGAESERFWWHGGAVLFSVLGMMSKEVMATAPILALLFDRTFLAGSFRLALRRRWGLYIGLAAGWLVLATQLWSDPHIGMVGFSGLGWWQYAVNQFAVIAKYLKLICWPHPLLLDYGPPRPLSLAAVAPQAVLVVALLIAVVAALRYRPRIGFAGAWFFVILAPTSSFIPILTEVGAERRLYLPLASVVTLIVLAVDRLFRRRGSRAGNRWRRGVGGLLFGIVFAALVVATYHRNGEYRSARSIWQTVVDRFPENHRGHNNLGVELAAAGQLDRALQHYREAVRIYPGYADARINLGNALAVRRRWTAAVEQYRFALEVNPEIAELHYNLARALAATEQAPQAVDHYRKALRLDPRYVKAHNNLGATYLSTGQIDLAIEHLQAALRLDPDFAGAYFNLGIAFEYEERIDEALQQFRKAAALEPDWEQARERLLQLRRQLRRESTNGATLD
jgi:tetratricopeptide (TPR) repeat protein